MRISDWSSDVCSSDLGEIPTELQLHMKDRSAWFWRMRDIRDYIAHHGFVHFHLVESPAGTLQFFIQHRLNMRDLAREFMVGLDEMLFVIDQSFTKRLVGA